MPTKKKSRVRWECPNELHPGVLGSTRPRKDDVMRFCLPCSADTGRLVERVAPSLERKRAAKTAQARAKAQTKRDRDVAKKQQYPYVLDEIFKRVKKLSCWRREVKSAQMEWTYVKTQSYASGHASYQRIRVRVGTVVGNAIEVIVHELTHVAFYRRYGDVIGTQKDHHDERFHAMLRAASRELLGDRYLDDIRPTTGTKYDLDRALEPLYNRAVEDGVFGDLPIQIKVPPPKKRSKKLPPLGQVTFSVPGSVWAACFYDDGANPGSVTDATWAALEAASWRRAGKGESHTLTTTIAVAQDIARDLADHYHVEERYACERCAQDISIAILYARQRVAHMLCTLIASLRMV